MSMFDIFNMLDGMSKGTAPKIDRTVLDGFIISTVDTHDCGPETAIIDENNTHIVERYSSVEEAQTGHAKWVKFLQEGNRNITDIGYGESIESENRILVSNSKFTANMEENNEI